MEEKKPFGSRLEAFFAGRGFYIVLFLCVAVIGVSAWSLLSGGGAQTEEAPDIAVDKLDEHSFEPPAVPAAPAVTEAPAAPAQVTVPEETVPAQAEEPRETAPVSAPAQEEPAAPVSAPADDYFIRPVSGAADVGYCMDVPVFNPTMQDWRTHDGVDFTAELGEQVRACANGTVTAVYVDDLLGSTVVIGHRDGLESVYANLAAAPNVAVGDWVGAGQVIGAVGSTAIGEAGQVCHLHFAMRQNGASVDPAAYLP